LIGQTYNIPGNLASFLLTVGILSIPAIYLFRSAGAATIYMVGLVWRRLDAFDRWSLTTQHAYLVFWMMLAALIPLLFVLARWEKMRGVKWLVSLMPVAMALALWPDHIDTWGVMCAYALLCSAVVGFSAFDKGGNYLGKFPFVMALAGLFLLLMITSFSGVWAESGFSREGGELAITLLLVSLGLVCCAFLALVAYRRDWMGVIWVGIGPLLIVFRLVTQPDTGGATGWFLVNALGLVVGVLTMILGYTKGRMSRVNGGLAVISGILLMRFFDGDLSMVYRGVGFIVIGVMFVVVNFKLSGKLKKVKAS